MGTLDANLSMTDSLKATEAECAIGRTAPRVSLDDINANIVGHHAFVAADALHALGSLPPEPGALDLLSICILQTRNGFTIIGKSAPASRDNFDAALGAKLAYEDAVRQLWPLMGYALRDKLADRAARAAAALVPPRDDMPAYVGTKVMNAKPMTRGDYCALRGWDVPADEDASDAGYLVEYTDKLDGNVPGFDGYVSWSPADVFERAYSPVNG